MDSETTAAIPEDVQNQQSHWIRWVIAAIVAGIFGLYALKTTAEFSLTGRPVFDMVALLAAGNFLWYLFVRTFPGWSKKRQFGLIASAIIVQCILFATLRMDGLYGNGRPKFTNRWISKSADRFFASANNRSFEFDAESNPLWGEFRGKGRTGSFESVEIGNLNEQPPVQTWAVPVGSAWSSFAIADTVCLTQEQRGEFESVVCYELATGKQLWVHEDSVRFTEPTSGEGPRATPTIDRDLVFTLGASGILNCLEIATGKKIWSRDVLKENNIENRNFGMTGSPLVHNDLVIIAPGSNDTEEGTALIGYRRSDGQPIWSSGNETTSYSSPQFATVCGVPAVLCLNGDGLSGHRLSDGQAMFHVHWTSNAAEKNNVCQPLVFNDQQEQKTRIFISSGYGRGAAVFEVSPQDSEYQVETVWKNKFLKSKFSSAVTKDQFVYGLDNGILTCLSLEDGSRMWKQGRYGHGQLIRIGSHLIVLAEKGFLAQVDCDPTRFNETARLDALQDRTWNHPSFDGKYLLVRNDQEAICFELPITATATASTIGAQDNNRPDRLNE